MANIITTLSLEMGSNWYVSKKLNSVGRVGENTVTKLIIEPTEILEGVTYEIEIADASGSKNVAELTIDGTELYLILTANMLTTSGIMKMQVRGLFTDGSIKKSNIFELKVNRSISATEHYEEYAVTIFDQLVNECKDIIDGAESYVVRAETAAVNAEAYSESASASAQAASASEATATSASTAAVNAASTATEASTSAHTSAETATNAANSASTSATSANTSATNAANSASAAATSATNAHTSEVNASTSETNASTSATEAAASAESIAASVAQINENTYRINDLEAIIAGYQQADLPTGAVASITDGTALLMPSLKIGIEPVQSGSGDPSPDNIRPIEGWTAANVTRSGKNLWNTDDITSILVGTITRNGLYFRQSGQYTISVQNSGNYLYCRVFNADGTIKETYHIVSMTTITNATFTISDGEYFAVYDAMEGSIDISKSRFNSWLCQVERNSTATTYEPYNSTTYNIQFKDGDNPLTVYGGELNVVDGTLTVTDAHIASYNAETLPSTWISDRDVYAEGTVPTTGAEVVYKLANSATYQLTPTQIRTLVGNNNIWTDTGDIISGKYFKSLS